MSKLKLRKLVAVSLVVCSVFLLNPIETSAEWNQDYNGWWNTEGSSWSIGWREIDGEWYYFDNKGYMKTGWLQYGGKWYYLDTNGIMLKNTIINGYSLNSNGEWIQINKNSLEQSNGAQNNLSNININAMTISGITGIKLDDVTKIVFYDGRGGLNRPVMVGDKEKIKKFMGYLDCYLVKKTQNPETTGWTQKAIFYINDKEVINIVFGDPLTINNDYFKISKGSLNTDKIDEFLKSIDSSHLTTAEINARSVELNDKCN